MTLSDCPTILLRETLGQLAQLGTLQPMLNVTVIASPHLEPACLAYTWYSDIFRGVHTASVAVYLSQQSQDIVSTRRQTCRVTTAALVRL